MDPSQIPNQPFFQKPRPRSNWKKHKSKVAKKFSAMAMAPDGSNSYYPPSLQDLQTQNYIKARRFFKKKYPDNRFVPDAPYNTTSFLIRSKGKGWMENCTPSPVTPAVLPTPRFSPTREFLVDMAKEEWGVDGYGSMSGLIRLRSPKAGDHEEDGSSDSSESDVEEHVEVERRLDHDLSRFEMINYPMGPDEPQHSEGPQAEARVARLEEENLTLRERLFLVETEVGEIKRRLEKLEKRFLKGNGMEVDGTNGVEENQSGGDVDGRYMGEENVNREHTNGGRVADENVHAEDVIGGNRGEDNMVGEDLGEDFEEDLSPATARGVGTPVRH